MIGRADAGSCCRSNSAGEPGDAGRRKAGCAADVVRPVSPPIHTARGRALSPSMILIAPVLTGTGHSLSRTLAEVAICSGGHAAKRAKCRPRSGDAIRDGAVCASKTNDGRRPHASSVSKYGREGRARRRPRRRRGPSRRSRCSRRRRSAQKFHMKIGMATINDPQQEWGEKIGKAAGRAQRRPGHLQGVPAEPARHHRAPGRGHPARHAGGLPDPRPPSMSASTRPSWCPTRRASS